MSDPSHDTPSYDPNFTGTPPTGYPNQLPFPLSLPYPSPLPAPYVPTTLTSSAALAVPSYDPVSYDPSAAVPYDPNTAPYHPSLAPGYNSSSGSTYLQTLQDTTSPNDNDIEMKSNSSSTSEVLRAIRKDIHAQREEGQQQNKAVINAVNDLKVEVISLSKLMSKSIESNYLLLRQMTGCDITNTAAMAAAEAIAHGMSKLSTQAAAILGDGDQDGDKDQDGEEDGDDVE